MKIKEGYINFKDHKTYYRTVGECTGQKKPLILLHGGPGSTHNYFEILDDVAEKDGRMLVMYDQIGCGLSYIEGHPEYFTSDVWIEELITLRKELRLNKVHILGQSWGGIMALLYALDHNPEGVKSYILASTLPSAKLWESEQYKRIEKMEDKYQKAIEKAVKSNDYTDPVYLEAVDIFMDKYCNPNITEDSPECLTRQKKSGAESYMVGWGPNEFTPKGTLSGFEVTDRLGEIKTPCLITSGGNDLCSPLIAKTMYDGIPGSRWEMFENSRHMSFADEHDKYVEILIEWLNKND